MSFHGTLKEMFSRMRYESVSNGCVRLLQYYHSVRIFAGQDPSCVWVGWVTPDYHYYSTNFSLSKNRTVTVTLGDERGRVHERWVLIVIRCPGSCDDVLTSLCHVTA